MNENKKIILPKVIVICGTNASGKSDLGVEVALKFNGEVISADSRQIYKGFDLCSGKIKEEDKKLIPHHLIDTVSVGDYFSLADYQNQVYAIIDEIIKKGKLPIIVGGTGLYIQSIVDGYKLLDVDLDESLRVDLYNKDLQELVTLLMQKDLSAYNSVDLKNKVRVIRALEIAYSGYTYDDTRKKMPKYNCLQIGVAWQREILYNRIDKRLKERVDNGMIEEVRNALNEGIKYESLKQLGLEYRYIADFINGEYANITELIEKLGFAIHAFARRQVTWFNKDKRIVWIDMSDNPLVNCEKLINEFINT
jgi:tRNA dimethylallyltransferase